ncbi:Golgi-associated RAB2 interactor protein 2 isoform X2 [Pelodiscus sinensis]|nr:protein FAM71D isoform X2 [Pelodiscus sinensis]XP_025035696.1 protein FAM71D isoform X2 [Pelodiscus sinensis]|eukprot:XP_025035695.1 protein FAM71D isoform X2 [Pelodiscus sinensis]
MLLAHTVTKSPQEVTSKPWKVSKQPPTMEQLELSRFFPLKFVEISVHNAEKRRLKLKLASGRSFYLELCGPPDEQHLLFRQWLRLISLLKLPQDRYNNTQVNIVYENFNGKKAEGTQVMRNQSDNRDMHLDTQNSTDSPESGEEEVAKQVSKRVTISDIVGPIEECGSSKRGLAVATRSSIKETKRDPSMQSEKKQRKNHQEIKKSKSTEKKKSRDTIAENKTENNLQASGNLKHGSKSGVICCK